jgi:Fe2+ or Zn2+ uptake regulation protein
MQDFLPEKAADLLRQQGVKPSHQRVMVLAHLLSQQSHPTVESIHRALLPRMRTLSKTTVYNTLGALEKAGLVRVVHIEDNEARYDVITHEHGHFKCERCGAVQDFDVDMQALQAHMPAHCMVRERNVYFKGICEACLEKMNHQLEHGKEGFYEEHEGDQDR